MVKSSPPGPVLRMALAIGEPTSKPILAVMNVMDMRPPSADRSGDRLATVGENATERGTGIDDGKLIKRKTWGDAGSGAGIKLNVVESDIDAHVAEEETATEKNIVVIAQRGKINKLAGLG
ncbi:MAG: hypothetical protein Q9160_008864 [Pyrenula sp. 1 TL-2023]